VGGPPNGAVYSIVPTNVNMRLPNVVCFAVPKSVKIILAPGWAEVRRILSGCSEFEVSIMVWLVSCCELGLFRDLQISMCDSMLM